MSVCTVANRHVGLAGSRACHGQKCISRTPRGACTLDVVDFNSMRNDSSGCSEERVIAVCWNH